MKTFIKRLITFAVILFISIYVINSETDWLKSFDSNFPEIAEKYPEAASAAKDLSELLSRIPSISQLAAHITNEEMPLSPEEFADNAYIKNSPLLNFYDRECVGISVNDDNTVSVFGVSREMGNSNIIVRMVNGEEVLGETYFAADTEFKFSKKIDIPETSADKISVEVYSGERRFGNYDGWVNAYAYIQKQDGKWIMYHSPVAEKNSELYAQKRAKTLKATPSVQSDSASIKSVAEQLTADAGSDYEKLLKIHDWICTYVHYDYDSLASGEIAPYVSTEVLKTQKAVCLGYANLYAALCRSINIPCSVVTGYALGISSGSTRWNDENVNGSEENHAWNEAYVDGRWVIIDATWDTYNSFENGKMKKGNHISHLYFDANIDFFSNNHRIMKYN